MKKILTTFVLLCLIAIMVIWGVKKYQQTKEEATYSLQLNQLRGTAKLVIWEQSFTLNNTETISKKYLGIIETKESIHSSIDGKMGFHIDLADSINTHFVRHQDTLYVEAPLQNTYIELDLSSLQQIKESSLDPTLEIKKEEVIKSLKRKAVEEYIPTIKNQLSYNDIAYQESKLSNMIGRPVRIKITAFPEVSSFDWGDKR